MKTTEKITEKEILDLAEKFIEFKILELKKIEKEQDSAMHPRICGLSDYED